MKKIILLLTGFIVVYSISSFAQSFGDKLFLSHGIELLYAKGPANLTTIYERESENDNWKDSDKKLDFIWKGGYLAYQFKPRLNLLEVNNDLSFSASLPASFGILVNWEDKHESSGYGSLHIPLFFELNYGVGSTYSSNSNMGVVFGVGVQWDYLAIFADNNNYEDNYGTTKKIYESGKKSWVHPTIEFGVRYWNGRNKLNEINIRYGFSGKTEWTDMEGNNISHSPMIIQLSLLRVMNY